MKDNFRQKLAGMRSQSGLALVTLVALIAVCVVGPLVVAAYEVIEYNFCQLELKHCVDAAALAAGCGQVASTSSDVSTNEQYAMNQALFVFQQNTILGRSLSNATSSYASQAGTITTIPVTAAANQAMLYFEFIDPYTGNQVGFGGTAVAGALNTSGKIIRTVGIYGFVPQLARFAGLNSVFQATAQSDAGLPQLDLVFCFDTSQSLDDYTNIALVNRYCSCTTTRQDSAATVTNHWDTAGFNGYTLLAVGPLAQVLGATNMTEGCPVSAGYPQEQDACNACSWKPNFQGHGWNFSQPPYYSASHTSAFPPNTYTDLVVPLDGNGCTTAVTVPFHYLIWSANFQFPAGMQGIAVLVEAQRANLESVGIASAAGCYTSGSTALGQAGTPGVTLSQGYFEAYFTAVMGVIDQQNPLNASLNTAVNLGPGIVDLTGPVSAGGVNPMPLRHPLGDCVDAAENFFQAVWNDADVHFGLVVFNDQVGAPTVAQGNVANPQIFNGSADSVVYTPLPNISQGSVTGGASDYPGTPVFNLYSKPVTVYLGGDSVGSNTGSGITFTSVTPPDRALIPLPQLLLQKTPGPLVQNSLFDTTVPPGQPTAWGSINYCIYNYAQTTATAQGGSNIAPFCLTPYGGTNLTLAINAAVAQFSSSSGGGGQRLGSTPAIVLFTDGVPSVGVDSASAAATAAAQASRTAQGLQSIPIYTVGLSAIQAAGFQTAQQTCLQNISTASGIGATSYQVVVANPTASPALPTSPWNATNSNSASQQLDRIFQNLARQLVCLVN